MTEFLRLQESLLGRYSLDRELGRGGMGTVWLARDIRLDRLVAIKTLHPDLAARPGARARFITEARTAARLAHPHVVPVFAVEADNDPPLLVMAWIDGESAADRLARRGAMPAVQVERLLREIAWALGYAHASGVTHRDLTLGNVLIEHATGRALLADFGLAEQRTDATGDAPEFGTPGYLAPEVIRGEAATPQSDLYALGVIGYTLLAGRPPFVADSTGELLARSLVSPAPPLAPLAPGVSRRLIAAIESCLAHDPDQRPASGDALVGRLEASTDPVAVAPPLATWFSRWQRFRPIYAIAAPVLGLQSWLLMFGYFSSGRSGLLLASLLSSMISLTAVPLVAHAGAEFLALRRLRQQGFDIADIRAAWAQWTAQLQQRYDREGLRPLAGRVVFDLTLLGGIGVAVTWLGLLLLPLFPGVGTAGISRIAVNALLGISTTVYLGVTIGLGISFIAPGVRVKPDGRLRRLLRWMWHSPAATRLARLAGTGQRHRLVPSGTLHRPTEMVLGLAIDEIWQSLPVALREQVGQDVPQVAAALCDGAEALRLSIDELRTAADLLPTHHAEAARLQQLRVTLEHRQQDTITTLERLRSQLLRSLADRQLSADLTHHLAHGRELERTLLFDVAAQDEVRRLLHRATRPLTPRHTPASPSPVGA